MMFSADLVRVISTFCVNFLISPVLLSIVRVRYFCGDCRSPAYLFFGEQRQIAADRLVSHRTCTWCCSCIILETLVGYLICSQVHRKLLWHRFLVASLAHGSFFWVFLALNERQMACIGLSCPCRTILWSLLSTLFALLYLGDQVFELFLRSAVDSNESRRFPPYSLSSLAYTMCRFSAKIYDHERCFCEDFGSEPVDPFVASKSAAARSVPDRLTSDMYRTVLLM